MSMSDYLSSVKLIYQLFLLTGCLFRQLELSAGELISGELGV